MYPFFIYSADKAWVYEKMIYLGNGTYSVIDMNSLENYLKSKLIFIDDDYVKVNEGCNFRYNLESNIKKEDFEKLFIKENNSSPYIIDNEFPIFSLNNLARVEFIKLVENECDIDDVFKEFYKIDKELYFSYNNFMFSFKEKNLSEITLASSELGGFPRFYPNSCFSLIHSPSDCDYVNEKHEIIKVLKIKGSDEEYTIIYTPSNRYNRSRYSVYRTNKENYFVKVMDFFLDNVVFDFYVKNDSLNIKVKNKENNFDTNIWSIKNNYYYFNGLDLIPDLDKSVKRKALPVLEIKNHLIDNYPLNCYTISIKDEMLDLEGSVLCSSNKNLDETYDEYYKKYTTTKNESAIGKHLPKEVKKNVVSNTPCSIDGADCFEVRFRRENKTKLILEFHQDSITDRTFFTEVDGKTIINEIYEIP